MSILAVDEVALREPRLLVPCLAPIEPVRIDPAFAKAPTFLMLGRPSDVTIATAADCGFAVDEVGPSIRTAVVATSRNAYYSKKNVGIAGAMPRTIFCHLKFNPVTTSDRCIFTYGADGTANLFELYLDNGSSYDIVGHFYGSGYNTGSTPHPQLTSGAVQSFGFTYDGNVAVRSYKNGVFVKETTLPNVLSTVVSQLYVGGTVPYTVLTPANFSNYMTTVIGRCLSDAEMLALAADPYQFLIPA